MEAADTPKPAYNGDALAKEGAKWLERIRAAEKREDKWRKDAEAAEKAFACDTDSKGSGKLYDFNILHSNVETIVPAIYNSTPIPDIRRRFVEAIGDEPQPPPQQEGMQPDPRAMLAFQQAQQAFAQKQQMDADAKNLGDMVERAIQVQIDDNRLDKEIEQVAQDSFLSGRGITVVKFEADFDETGNASKERIEFEAFSWRDFRIGPGTRWDNLPWIAFRHVVTSEALEKYKDKEMYAAQEGFAATVAEVDEEKDGVAFWKVWCKDTRKVKFIRENDGRILKEVDDPLGLPGFFPTPEPVQPITLTSKMRPVCPFTVYKKLADELDSITKRINAIMKGLKVKGGVVGEASDIINLANAGDNELVAINNVEGLAQTKGLENAILWWPIEKAIAVLKELYVQRETVKASIYEITGISDIVRGASNANETLGAQEIKTKWGALRIQKMQRMIERQVRDIFVMMADLILSKFSPQTLQTMTGIQITPGMQALMQQPTLAGYRIDVESDSTVRADLTRQKGEMTEFLAGSGQFFGTMAPLVQQAPEMAEPMAEVYSAFARVFKLGKQAEDALERMSQTAKKKAKEPPPPNPEQMKAEQEAKQSAQEHEFKMTEMQAESERAAEEHRMTMDEKRLDARSKRQQAKADSNAKRAESGLPPEPDTESIDAEMLLKELSAARGQMQEAIVMMAKVMTAPKRIVKGPDGRPEGVETVLN